MAKITVKVCDCCNRNLKEVDKSSYSGRGQLMFQWTIGGDGGGTGNEISLEDICVECSQELRGALNEILYSLSLKKE